MSPSAWLSKLFLKVIEVMHSAMGAVHLGDTDASPQER
jgi:hypothetical protein